MEFFSLAAIIGSMPMANPLEKHPARRKIFFGTGADKERWPGANRKNV
jgi:hypothetical protein